MNNSLSRITLVVAALAVAVSGCTSTEPAPTPPPSTSLTSTLPASMHAKTADTLKVGESGYMVPWAAWVDTNSRMWLSPKHRVGPQKGTSTMRVERRSDGFHVWPPPGAEYTPTEDPFIVGVEDSEWIPVVAIEGAP